MGSTEFNVYTAKTQFSRLVARAEHGDRLTITRNGRPVARLIPFTPDQPVRTPGTWAGRIEIADDFDTLSEDDLRDWYGE
ncbi:type II toxin-antitoxin system prevent-host-death family antitoxin [Tsukamurella sp. NPDC003166]|uniref:type II toxin-antitoxin system Phd/YefM family antitoxin n=1 Tax=Tsukamurella sp. NPDC003166 TaxID=3154444 RepID=UPI0033A54690